MVCLRCLLSFQESNDGIEGVRPGSVTANRKETDHDWWFNANFTDAPSKIYSIDTKIVTKHFQNTHISERHGHENMWSWRGRQDEEFNFNANYRKHTLFQCNCRNDNIKGR